ncbi:MAG: hypothetical protein Q8Q08_13045 [Candidatus Omnitrophota bacterium]|nr:hypothetical protein [Candidatus Omnitrophota bacterium]
MPDFKQEHIDELFGMYATLSDVQAVMDEQVKTAKAQHGDVRITVQRGDEEQEVPQKALWEELYYLGWDSPAAKDLEALYPELFKTHAHEQELIAGINAYEELTFGFTHGQMTMPNVLRLIQGCIRVEMEKASA